MWTGTVVGVLWSVYLWIISIQAMYVSRAVHVNDFSGHAPPSMWGVTHYRNKISIDEKRKIGYVPRSPWGEVVVSLVLFCILMAFLPAWRSLSGASSVVMLFGPLLLAWWCLIVGLTVQMLRLPLLLYDRIRLLALLEAEGLRAR